MSVSMSDVAKKAGVALSTVSKVLNNYPDISEKTKKKVLNAVEELDYSPNLIASALSSKHSKRVALIISLNQERQAIDEINMQYLFGAFNFDKYTSIELVTIFSTTIIDKNAREIKSYLKSMAISGMIIFGFSLKHLALREVIETQEFKCVIVDAPIVNDKTSSVMIDHLNAQYDVAKKTIELMPTKCNKVLYLAGGRDDYSTETRLEGIMKLRDEQGFDLIIEYCDFSEKKAYHTVMDASNDYDVIVCASDLMAIGSVKALKTLDIYHPVCGYDGITLLGYIDFALLTVKQDFYYLSEMAVKEMDRLFDNKKGRQLVLGYKIVTIDYHDIIN
jgi:LacI family transcriptional regulator